MSANRLATSVTTSDNPPLQDRAAMLALLDLWAAHGWLRPLDAAFAAFLGREVVTASPLLLLAAALTSHQLGRGHAGLDLAATLDDPGFSLSLPPEGKASAHSEEGIPLPLPMLPTTLLAGLSLTQWQAALDQPELIANGAGNTPLVRVGTRLYLRRYWQYEQDVRAGIEARLAANPALQAALPVAALQQTLNILFPASAESSEDEECNWQKLACALAARSAFSIITGGPGTGKTTTVVKLLALLQSLALTQESGRPLRIRLAAPTGKAAARLKASIASTVARLPLAGLAQAEQVRAAIPVEVGTVHRLLGSRPDSRHFRHHAGNLLALDVLVIDEASMIDLEMMASVLAALPPNARLILLGDKDQLASVEAGSVLGELCRRAEAGHYRPASRAWLQQVCAEIIPTDLLNPDGTALDQSVAMLRRSYRFTAESGIGLLAKAVNQGDAVKVNQVLAKKHRDLDLLELGPANGNTSESAFARLVIDGGERGTEGPGRPHGYRHYLSLIAQGPAAAASQVDIDYWAQQVLTAHGQFQLICALRRGPWGVEGLNLRIARLLQAAGLIPASEGWYNGRPVLVTRNDYSLGLMNGDIGITLALPLPGKTSTAKLRVAFPGADGSSIKWVLPSRLQAVETVFALTVHKSQGSEFTHTAMLLPDSLNPILTRELIYTGITRASQYCTLVQAGSSKVLEQSVRRQVLRLSGLLAKEN